MVTPGLPAIKLLHLAIASLTGWLIIRYSPFSLLQKILLLAGYFFLYEYAVIVRNYAPGILFVFIACALFPKRRSPGYFLLISLAVAAMMLFNFYAFFIGVAFMVLLAAEHASYGTSGKGIWKFLPGYAVMIAGAVLFFADTLPPADYGYAGTWNTALQISSLVSLFDRACRVFFPLPEISVHFWNSIMYPNIYLRAFLGLLVIAGAVFLFARKGLARLFIIVAFVMLLGFSYVKFNGYLRHNGHLYIAFIAMLWIREYLPGKEPGRKKAGKVLFTGILIIQLVAAVMAVGFETIRPFSQAKPAAEYIRSQFPGSIILAYEDVGTSSVSAYLDQPVYYPQSGRFGTFIIWNAARLRPVLTTASILRRGDSLENLYRRKVVYLFNYYPVDSAAHCGLELRKTFAPSVEPMESYYVYTKKICE
jgi:hypothetical protein